MVRSTIFAQKPTKAPAHDTVNKSGGAAYSGDLKQDVLSLLTTNVIGNTFYATEQDLAAQTVELMTRAAQEDPGFLGKALVYARNEGFMRLAPIVGLAALTVYGTSPYHRTHVKGIFPRIIRTPDDLREYVTLFNTRAFGKRMTGWVTKMVGNWLNSMSEYHAVKYGSKASKDITLRDILRLAHPKPVNDRQDLLFHYLTKGVNANDLSRSEPADLKIVWATERLKTAGEDEIIRLVKAHNLPWEVVIPALERSTPAVWAALAGAMPYFALLRNLATLQRNGALDQPGITELVALRLSNPEAIARAKLFPFRYFQAARKITNVPLKIQHAVEDALETSIGNLPDVEGQMVVAVDESGSMSGPSMGSYSDLTCSDIARTLAGILYRRYGAKVCVFNTDAKWSRGHLQSTSVLDAAKTIDSYPGGTSLASPVRLMMADRTPCDVFVALTDNESYVDKGVPQVLRDYRGKMGIDTRGFLVNLQPSTTWQASVNDPLVKNISGFSDQALKFIGLQAKGGPRAQVEYVESLDITKYDKVSAAGKIAQAMDEFMAD